MARPVRQEPFKLLLAEKCGWHPIDDGHVAAQPEDVVLFGHKGLVLAADHLPQPEHGFNVVHW